jgi:hypothetical protein
MVKKVETKLVPGLAAGQFVLPEYVAKQEEFVKLFHKYSLPMMNCIIFALEYDNGFWYAHTPDAWYRIRHDDRPHTNKWVRTVNGRRY